MEPDFRSFENFGNLLLINERKPELRRTPSMNTMRREASQREKICGPNCFGLASICGFRHESQNGKLPQFKKI